MSSANGFTLVELIVVSALLMIVGGGLLTTFMTGQTSYLSADAYVQVQQEARRAFDNVVRELREAGSVDPVNSTVNYLNFQIARGYNSEPACQAPNPVGICWGSDDPTAAGSGDWVHYATIGAGNAAQLIRWTTDTGPAATWGGATCNVAARCRVLANHVNTDIANSIFNYTSATKVITVKLQIRYTSPLLPSGSQATPTLTSQVKLRN